MKTRTLVLLFILFAACSGTPESSPYPVELYSHTIISGEEAAVIYHETPGNVLLDVRSWEEYAEAHIEGSVWIPHSELEERLGELPDTETVIIVYCRAGVRSKAAAEVLIEAGFVRVYDMQSIEYWPGNLISG
jgi:rhodanese-related sulfurtransferase